MPLSVILIPCSLTQQCLEKSYSYPSSSLTGDQLPLVLLNELNGSVEITSLNRQEEEKIFTTKFSSSSTTTARYFAYSDERAKVAILNNCKPCPNIRATSLAFACGLHGVKFYGDVYIGKYGSKDIIL